MNRPFDIFEHHFANGDLHQEIMHPNEQSNSAYPEVFLFAHKNELSVNIYDQQIPQEGRTQSMQVVQSGTGREITYDPGREALKEADMLLLLQGLVGFQPRTNLDGLSANVSEKVRSQVEFEYMLKVLSLLDIRIDAHPSDKDLMAIIHEPTESVGAIAKYATPLEIFIACVHLIRKMPLMIPIGSTDPEIALDGSCNHYQKANTARMEGRLNHAAAHDMIPVEVNIFARPDWTDTSMFEPGGIENHHRENFGTIPDGIWQVLTNHSVKQSISDPAEEFWKAQSASLFQRMTSDADDHQPSFPRQIDLTYAGNATKLAKILGASLFVQENSCSVEDTREFFVAVNGVHRELEFTYRATARPSDRYLVDILHTYSGDVLVDDAPKDMPITIVGIDTGDNKDFGAIMFSKDYDPGEGKGGVTKITFYDPQEPDEGMQVEDAWTHHLWSQEHLENNLKKNGFEVHHEEGPSCILQHLQSGEQVDMARFTLSEVIRAVTEILNRSWTPVENFDSSSNEFETMPLLSDSPNLERRLQEELMSVCKGQFRTDADCFLDAVAQAHDAGYALDFEDHADAVLWNGKMNEHLEQVLAEARITMETNPEGKGYIMTHTGTGFTTKVPVYNLRKVIHAAIRLRERAFENGIQVEALTKVEMNGALDKLGLAVRESNVDGWHLMHLNSLETVLLRDDSMYEVFIGIVRMCTALYTQNKIFGNEGEGLKIVSMDFHSPKTAQDPEGVFVDQLTEIMVHLGFRFIQSRHRGEGINHIFQWVSDTNGPVFVESVIKEPHAISHMEAALATAYKMGLNAITNPFQV